MTVDEISVGSPAASADGGRPVPQQVSGMRAQARVATELRTSPGGRQRSCVSTLRSQAPLALRLTRAKAREPWAAHAADIARVSLAAGAGGPVGGDQLILRVEVGPGSSLVLSEISPTLLLPGPRGERSATHVRIQVAAGATLIWLPEPIIAARGCDHVHNVVVDLDEGARLFMREELLLGRHGEETGRVTQRVSVRHGGRPLYRQDIGIGTAGADTPAVIGHHRAVGSALIVDPSWLSDPPSARALPGDAALLPLSGPAALITASAGDNLELRAQLHAGLTALGPPWDPGR